MDNIGNLMKPEELKEKVLDPRSWMGRGLKKNSKRKRRRENIRE